VQIKKMFLSVNIKTDREIKSISSHQKEDVRCPPYGRWMPRQKFEGPLSKKEALETEEEVSRQCAQGGKSASNKFHWERSGRRRKTH